MDEDKKTLEKQLDALDALVPRRDIYEYIAKFLVERMYSQSKSHLNFVEDLRGVCETMTKSIEILEENMFSENPKIKMVVLVEDPDGLYMVV